MAHRFDEIDRTLLERLMTDGRASWATLAREVGLTPPSVTERVRKLERSGVIRGFEVVVDPETVGYGLVAYISITAASAFDPPEFMERVSETPEILECYLLTGEYDYLLKVLCRSSDHLYEILQRVQTWQGVGHTRSSLVLKTGKETRQLPLDAIVSVDPDDE